MQYRNFGKTGRSHFPLGFGMMRLKKDENGQIDQNWVNETLRSAIDQGLNYVDTAYVYPGSEMATGIALSGGYREKVTLASKMPVSRLTCEADFDRILDEELERLQTDHIDCYLLHALSDERWENYVVKYNVLAHMEQAKAAGKIRHIGFSFHDSLDSFKRILNAYDGWEFCQIQLNYMDVNYQAGLAGLELAANQGLAVVIMEPLRGGRLANVPREVASRLPFDPVESALNFLWHRPEVSVVLSGMSETEQVQQNLQYAQRSTVGMLDFEQWMQLIHAGDQMRKILSVPCTGCDYCGVCPQNIAISKIFAIHNQEQLDGDGAKAGKAYRALGDRTAEKCVQCGACVEQCPQGIAVFQELEKIHKRLG